MLCRTCLPWKPGWRTTKCSILKARGNVRTTCPAQPVWRKIVPANNVSADDLTEALRMQQVDHVKDTSLVTFERGGTISVNSKKPDA